MFVCDYDEDSNGGYSAFVVVFVLCGHTEHILIVSGGLVGGLRLG